MPAILLLLRLLMPLLFPWPWRELTGLVGLIEAAPPAIMDEPSMGAKAAGGSPEGRDSIM